MLLLLYWVDSFRFVLIFIRRLFTWFTRLIVFISIQPPHRSGKYIINVRCECNETILLSQKLLTTSAHSYSQRLLCCRLNQLYVFKICWCVQNPWTKLRLYVHISRFNLEHLLECRSHWSWISSIACRFMSSYFVKTKYIFSIVVEILYLVRNSIFVSTKTE